MIGILVKSKLVKKRKSIRKGRGANRRHSAITQLAIVKLCYLLHRLLFNSFKCPPLLLLLYYLIGIIRMHWQIAVNRVAQ